MTTNTIEKNFFFNASFLAKGNDCLGNCHPTAHHELPQCHANCPTRGFVRACIGTAPTTFWGDKDNEWL